MTDTTERVAGELFPQAPATTPVRSLADVGFLTFTVTGVPITQGSKTSGVSKTGKRYVRESSNSKARALAHWRQLVMDQAQRHAPAHPLEGPIRLDMMFYLPLPKSAPKRRRLSHTKKPDRLKLARAVEDALRGVFYRDDSQVVEGDTVKRYAYPGYPVGVTITIEELQEGGEWSASTQAQGNGRARDDRGEA